MVVVGGELERFGGYVVWTGEDGDAFHFAELTEAPHSVGEDLFGESDYTVRGGLEGVECRVGVRGGDFIPVEHVLGQWEGLVDEGVEDYAVGLDCRFAE